MDQEAAFFKSIAPRIINLVDAQRKVNKVVKSKGQSNDFATKLDVEVERLIVEEIQKIFPNDTILAEEEYSDGTIGVGRVWIIDPICGTTNLVHDISVFCSNIALAQDGELIASCVVDFLDRKFYWSTGGDIIFCQEKEYKNPQKNVPGTLIDVDFGASIKAVMDEKMHHLQGVKYLEKNTDYMLLTLNSSLTSLYVALRKVDGTFCMNTKPWDIAAAAFLIQQSGAIIKDGNGKDFMLESHSFIAAGAGDVMDVLTRAFSKD